MRSTDALPVKADSLECFNCGLKAPPPIVAREGDKIGCKNAAACSKRRKRVARIAAEQRAAEGQPNG